MAEPATYAPSAGETVSPGNGSGTPAHPQRIAKEPQSLAVPQPAPAPSDYVDVAEEAHHAGYDAGYADAAPAQPATALKPCKTHGLDGHLYDCDAVRWVPYQPAPDALREAAHVVEQQGLALGRLREAARAVVRDTVGQRLDRNERVPVDPALIVALSAAIEEADRG